MGCDDERRLSRAERLAEVLRRADGACVWYPRELGGWKRPYVEAHLRRLGKAGSWR